MVDDHNCVNPPWRVAFKNKLLKTLPGSMLHCLGGWCFGSQANLRAAAASSPQGAFWGSQQELWENFSSKYVHLEAKLKETQFMMHAWFLYISVVIYIVFTSILCVRLFKYVQFTFQAMALRILQFHLESGSVKVMALRATRFGCVNPVTCHNWTLHTSIMEIHTHTLQKLHNPLLMDY